MKFTEVPYDVLKSFFLNAPGMIPVPMGVYYFITSVVTSGSGTITPSGYKMVENNDTYTLDVTVNASNMAWVYLDGINTGWTAYNETKTYTLSNVTANHHITVRFGGV